MASLSSAASGQQLSSANLQEVQTRLRNNKEAIIKGSKQIMDVLTKQPDAPIVALSEAGAGSSDVPEGYEQSAFIEASLFLVFTSKS